MLCLVLSYVVLCSVVLSLCIVLLSSVVLCCVVLSCVAFCCLVPVFPIHLNLHISPHVVAKVYFVL